MSDHSIYYLIKPGDSLESISQKTGIPLNALWNMRNNTFLNVNHLNVGDQIVYKEGVATYENQLYGALSQKPEEPSIFNDPADQELISRDTINHASLPDDSALPECAPEIEDSSESQSNSHNNEGSNSPTKSCEVCENANMQCLCEVIVEVSKTKDGSSQKYYWISRKENRKAIPKVIVASGFPSGKLEGNGEETTIDYELKGRCEYQSDDECVQSEILTLSVPNGKYESNKTPSGTAGSIDLTYQEDLKLYADISSKRINIHPKPQHDSKINSGFINALKFLLLNELNDFPVNYRKLCVAECDKEKKINSEKVVTHLVSVPAYKVVFDIGIAFDGEGIEPAVYDKFKEEKLSPSIAQYGRAKGAVKVEVYYNNKKTEIEIPALGLTSIPVMNKLTAFFNTVKNERTKGGRVSDMGKSQFPISLSYMPPEIHIKGEAQFTGGGDTIVERSGTVNFDPILGGVLRINIFSFITKVTGAVGAVADKIIQDKFPEIVKVPTTDTKKRDNIIKGKELRWFGGAKAAAFFYLETKLEFKGSIELVPYDLLKPRSLPFAKPTLEAELEVGLYAGLYIEAKLFGFSGALSAGMVVKTSFSAEWRLDDGTFKVWHNGIWVEVFIRGEFSSSSNRGGVEYGSTGDTTVSGEQRWDINLMEARSKDNPMLILPKDHEIVSDSVKGTGEDIEINIRDEWIDDNPPQPPKDNSLGYRNQNWGRGGIGGGW